MMEVGDKVLACPRCGTEGKVLPRHYIDEKGEIHEDWSVILCLFCDQTARLEPQPREEVRRP